MINDTISIGSLEVNQMFGFGTDWWVEKKKQSKTADSKRFIWFWEKVSLVRKMENSTWLLVLNCWKVMFVPSIHYCQNTLKTLKTGSSHGRKKTVTHRRLSAFGSKTLSLNAKGTLILKLQDYSATPYFRQGIRTWHSQWLPSCYGWHGGGLSFGKVALNHVWRSC